MTQDAVSIDGLDGLPPADVSVRKQTFLRCNGAEVPGLLSMEAGFSGALYLVFSERPDLGKRGRVVNLEFHCSIVLVRKASGVLGAVKAAPAVGASPIYRATIRPKRGQRRVTASLA